MAPDTYPKLQQLLQQALPTLSAGQTRIAKLVLDAPEKVALQSIRETAGQAGVHQSSVVRFATKFGLQGYPGLSHLCQQHLQQEAYLVGRLSRAQARSKKQDLLATTLAMEETNLRRSYARIDPADWEQTVTLLAQAERVHVMGLRKCLPVAQLLSYLLGLIRTDVNLLAPTTGALVDAIRGLHENDVFIGISTRHYTRETIQTFMEAKRRKLHTIAFTDSAASPLAAQADISYLIDAEGLTILRSIAGFVSIVQALATAVALKLGDAGEAHLQDDEALLKAFSVYYEHE